MLFNDIHGVVRTTWREAADISNEGRNTPLIDADQSNGDESHMI